MSSQGRIFNELVNCEAAVWCKLAPGIEPAKWAFICRYLGNLTPREFHCFLAQLQARRTSLRTSARGYIKGLLGLNSPQTFSDLPLVSTGPSGIGGEYQREIKS